MAEYKSNRLKNPNKATSRFDDVELPKLLDYTKEIKHFWDYSILFLHTQKGVYACVNDSRYGGEYNVHDAIENSGKGYTAYINGYDKEPVRFFDVEDCDNPVIFPKPSHVFKQFIKWKKCNFTGRHDQPVVSELGKKSIAKTLGIVVVNESTLQTKLKRMLISFERYESTIPAYVAEMNRLLETHLKEFDITPFYTELLKELDILQRREETHTRIPYVRRVKKLFTDYSVQKNKKTDEYHDLLMEVVKPIETSIHDQCVKHNLHEIEFINAVRERLIHTIVELALPNTIEENLG